MSGLTKTENSVALGFGRITPEGERQGSAVSKSEAQQRLGQILAVRERGEQHDEQSQDQLLEVIKKLQSLIQLAEHMMATSEGTPEEEAEIDHVFQQINEHRAQLQSAFDRVRSDIAQLDQKIGTTLASLDGKQDPETGSSLSNGALAEVFRMLHELQNKYTELNGIYSQFAAKNCELSAVVTTSTAAAARRSIVWEANKEIVQGCSALVNAGASAWNAYSNNAAMKKLDGEIQGLDSRRTKLEEYQSELMSHDGGAHIAAMGSGPKIPSGATATYSPEAQKVLDDRIVQLKMGKVNPKGVTDTHMPNPKIKNPTDPAHMSDAHAIERMTPDQRKAVKEHVDREHANTVKEINDKYTRHTHEQTQRGLKKDIGLGVMNAGVSGINSQFDMARAEWQNAQILGNENIKQVEKAADTNRQTGQGLGEQGIKTIDEIQALLSAARPN